MTRSACEEDHIKRETKRCHIIYNQYGVSKTWAVLACASKQKKEKELRDEAYLLMKQCKRLKVILASMSYVQHYVVWSS